MVQTEINEGDRADEGAWLTLETRGIYLDGAGPLSTREKIALPTNKSRKELSDFIYDQAQNLGYRVANMIHTISDEEIQKFLEETNETS